MSQSNAPPAYPKWLSVSIIVLLTAQVGLLWTHGSMLQRQHEDIQGLREDLQNLEEDLYQDQDGWDSNEEQPNPQPTRMARHPRPRRAVRMAWMQGQSPAPAGGEDAQEQAARKDLDAARQSGQEAVAKARTVQGQLSLEENARKAEEKARIMREGESWRIWMWVGAAVAAAALMLRLKLRRGA
jgi:hypothetical protein